MVTKSAIDPGEVLLSVRHPSAGGTVIFLGTIRNKSEGVAVEELEYQVYRKMALRRMLEIESQVLKRWPVKRVRLVHRYGRLEVGEISVAVAVACEHRAEAFEACRFAIDAIKRTLPLWKKEKARGRRGLWVKGSPIGT